MNAPVPYLRKSSAELHEFVLDEEWHDLCQAHVFLLTVGKAGHVLAFDKRLAVRCLDVPQRARGVANEGDRLASRKEGLD